MPGKCHVIGRLRDSSVDACLGSHACQITRHSIYVAQTVAQRRVMTAKFLYVTLFANVAECRVLCEGYRREYNTERPHQSLKYLTPVEFKQQWLKNRSQTTGD